MGRFRTDAKRVRCMPKNTLLRIVIYEPLPSCNNRRKSLVIPQRGGTLYSLNGKFLLESSAKCRIFAECVKMVDFYGIIYRTTPLTTNE